MRHEFGSVIRCKKCFESARDLHAAIATPKRIRRFANLRKPARVAQRFFEKFAQFFGRCAGEARDAGFEGPLALLSAEGALGFRATVVPLDEQGSPVLSAAGREALGVKAGDRVSITPLP